MSILTISRFLQNHQRSELLINQQTTQRDDDVQKAATQIEACIGLPDQTSLFTNILVLEKYTASCTDIIWSGSMDIYDNLQLLTTERRKGSLKCCIKMPPGSKEIMSDIWPQQFTMHIVRSSVRKIFKTSRTPTTLSLLALYDESNDLLAYNSLIQSTSSFNMSGCIVWENRPSTICVLFLISLPSGSNFFTCGWMYTCLINDPDVIDLLKDLNILNYDNPQQVHVLTKENESLKNCLKQNDDRFAQLLRNHQDKNAIMKEELQLMNEMLAKQKMQYHGGMEMLKVTAEKKRKAVEKKRKVLTNLNDEKEKNASLKKELEKNCKMLADQKKLHQEQMGMQKMIIAEKEKEMEVMKKKFLERDGAFQKLNQEITTLQYEKEKMVENISNRLESEFKCSICQEILIEASRLPWCGHKFCNYCVTTWLKEHADCPLCKGIAKSSIRCIALDEIIDNMIYDLGIEAKQKRRNALQEREKTICIGTLASSSEELEEGSMMSEESSTETAMSEEEGRSPEHSGRVREGPRATLTDSSSEGSSSDGLEGRPSCTEQEESTPYFSTLRSDLALSSSSSEDETTLS